MNIASLFKVAGDAVNDLPDIEGSIPLVKQLVTEAQAGTVSTLTADQLAQVGKDIADVEQLVADIKGATA